MNCYAYLNENPISYIDPFGLSADGDSWVTTGLSYGADAVPILGMVKGFQETITGVNYITGEQLSVADRVANGIGSLTGLIPIPGTKYVGKYGTEAAIDAGSWVVKQFGKKETKQVASKLPLKVNLQLFAGNIKKVPGMPPIVQSRINISNDGFNHVLEEHFSSKNKSQFTISPEELRSILSDKSVVNVLITRALYSNKGDRYVREVNLDKAIGTDKFNDFQPTSTITILTDKSGNLITVSPGIIK
ncbi:hypothetical protein PTI45_04014 [Paenibacillus nuruki]|uniref:Pre-toxin TG domain-containing protein n=1 Tax=Paenibacillus nuruki TaxID=1886670 RepID=A0A1E3KYJ4_9BACL|nr:hypothetical protein PTI45_04014 [Paenibacillus nuruki]